jgi:hypothetical protein
MQEVKMRKALPYVVDILIIAIFVLGPGIRGYGDWAVYEYILWGLILFYILYLRHTPRRK